MPGSGDAIVRRLTCDVNAKQSFVIDSLECITYCNASLGILKTTRVKYRIEQTKIYDKER